MPFKDINYMYLELWQPFRSPELNQLCNYARGTFLRNYFEFRPVVQKEMPLKDSFDGPFV